MLPNVRATAFTISGLLRESRKPVGKGVKLSPRSYSKENFRMLTSCSLCIVPDDQV